MKVFNLAATGTKGFGAWLRQQVPSKSVLWPDRIPATVQDLAANSNEVKTRLEDVEDWVEVTKSRPF